MVSICNQVVKIDPVQLIHELIPDWLKQNQPHLPKTGAKLLTGADSKPISSQVHTHKTEPNLASKFEMYIQQCYRSN